MDPTQLLFACSIKDKDNVMVATSNVSSCLALHKLAGFRWQTQRVEIKNLHGIADTGATSVVIKEDVPVGNKQLATKPLTVNLPNGCQVESTHTCNMVVPGLLRTLLGHIVPNLAIASLFGICPLCNTGCIVVFDKDKCNTWYDGKIILISPQNPSTDLSTLPFLSNRICKTMTTPPAVPRPNVSDHLAMASFTHLVWTRMNAVQFAHQLLGNPRISMLLKAVWHGFLNECPDISEKLVLKYINPSPATVKRHMKRPQHGIRSTTPKIASIGAALIQLFHPPLSVASNDAWDDRNAQLNAVQPSGPNIIFNKDRDEFITNIFAFGAFANKNSGIVHNNLTGLFPFMSLDGSVCFFVLYHNKSKSILADPIKGLDDKTILEVYKMKFDEPTK